MTDTSFAPTFKCEDCDYDVFVCGHWDGIPVCAVCRVIRDIPEMDEETKAVLRGLRD